MSFSAKNGNLKLGSIHSCTLVVKFNLIQLKRCPNTNTLTPTSLLQDSGAYSTASNPLPPSSCKLWTGLAGTDIWSNRTRVERGDAGGGRKRVGEQWRNKGWREQGNMTLLRGRKFGLVLFKRRVGDQGVGSARQRQLGAGAGRDSWSCSEYLSRTMNWSKNSWQLF